MKSCKRVVFSGTGCPDDLGNTLTAKGVTIESSWGATEMGMLGATHNRLLETMHGTIFAFQSPSMTTYGSSP